MTGVDINVDNSQTIDLIACYRPPNINYSSLENILELAETLNRTSNPIIIGGDLNLSDINWQGEVCDRKIQLIINKLVWDAGMTQVVDKPTHQNSMLDISPIDMLYYCDVIQGISDHNAVVLEINATISKVNDKIGNRIWQYRKADINGLQHFLKLNYAVLEKLGGGLEDMEKVQRNY